MTAKRSNLTTVVISIGFSLGNVGIKISFDVIIQLMFQYAVSSICKTLSGKPALYRLCKAHCLCWETIKKIQRIFSQYSSTREILTSDKLSMLCLTSENVSNCNRKFFVFLLAGTLKRFFHHRLCHPPNFCGKLCLRCNSCCPLNLRLLSEIMLIASQHQHGWVHPDMTCRNKNATDINLDVKEVAFRLLTVTNKYKTEKL